MTTYNKSIDFDINFNNSTIHFNFDKFFDTTTTTEEKKIKETEEITNNKPTKLKC